MKRIAILTCILLPLSLLAQLTDIGRPVPKSAYYPFYPNPFIAQKTAQNPKDCGIDTLRYGYYKGFSGPNYPSLGISDGYAVGQYFDAPVDITISGTSFYAFGAYSSDDSVRLTVNLYRAGTDSLPSGSPIRSTVVFVDTVQGTLTFTRIKQVVSFDSAYVANHPYIITIESQDSNLVAVVANSWTAGEGDRENIACATVGGTWYNCLNLNVGGTVLDCDFLIEPHVEYSMYADFESDQCFLLNDSAEFTNSSSPVIAHRMYNRLFLNELEYFSFNWNFGDQTGTFYDIDIKHLYANSQNYSTRLIATTYPYTTNSSCRDTAYKAMYFTPSDVTFKVDTPVCSGNLALITGSSTGNISWYSSFTDTAVLGAGPIYETDTLYTNLLLFAGASNNSCLSTRSGILVNVAMSPDDPLVTDDSICLNARANLQAYSNYGTVMWWDDSIAGMPVFFGNVYQTDTLSSSLTLYAQSNNRGCLSPKRIPVHANVSANNAPEAPTLPADTVICLYDGSISLIAMPSSGNQTHWYNQASGGTSIHIGDSLAFAPGQTGTKRIYAEAFDGQCASSRISTLLQIKTFPNKMIGSQDTLCLGDTAFFDYSNSPGSVRWYDSSLAGNLIYDTLIVALTGLTENTVFYLEPYLGTCRDTIRHAVEIDIIPFGSISDIVADPICQGETAVLKATKDFGTVLWSDQPKLSPVLALGDSFSTVPLTSSKIYYAGVLNYSCLSESQPVGIVVNPLPNAGFNYQVSTPGNVQFSAAGTGLTYIWDLGDGSNASSRSFSHQYTKNGTFTVKLVTRNNQSCIDSSQRNITVSGLSTGIAFPTAYKSKAYPNPSKGVFTLVNEDDFRHIQIFDLSGRLLHSQDLIQGANAIDAAQVLQCGIYIAVLEGYGVRYSLRLVIEVPF